MPLLDRLKRQTTRGRLRLGPYLTRETAILALLVVVTILATLGMAGSPTQSFARGLFDSPSETPDPNSPVLTPTNTVPAIVDTPTPIVAPTTEVPSPTAPSGVVPTVPPPLPSETFTPVPPPPPIETFTPVPVVDTPIPTQPPDGGGIPPTPTSIPLPTPDLPAPVQTVATISASITSTIGGEVPPVEEGPAPPAPAESERAFDLALFIDNFVIALGYIWICFGILFLVAAAIGGVWFLRRPTRGSSAPSNPAAPPYQPPAGPPPAAPQSWSAPAPSSPQSTGPGQPVTPGPDKPRAAARHKPAPPDDFDQPPSP